MKKCLFTLSLLFFLTPLAPGARSKISENTEVCIERHSLVNPGLVAAWKKSRMATITPEEAFRK